MWLAVSCGGSQSTELPSRRNRWVRPSKNLGKPFNTEEPFFSRKHPRVLAMALLVATVVGGLLLLAGATNGIGILKIFLPPTFVGMFTKGRREISFFLFALQQCWWFRFWRPTRLRYANNFIFLLCLKCRKKKISLVLASSSDGRIPVLLGQQQRHPGRGRVAPLGAQGQYMEFLQIIFQNVFYGL